MPSTKKPKRSSKKKKRSAEPNEIPWTWIAAGALAVLIVLIVVLATLGDRSTPAPKKQTEPKKQPAPQVVRPHTPKVEKKQDTKPAKHIRLPVGPPAPEYPAMLPPDLAIDVAALQKNCFDGALPEPMPNPDAVVFRVSRAAAIGSNSFRTIADAIKNASSDKQTIIEIHDNGPLFESNLPAIENRDVWIRAGAGYRPLIAWDTSKDDGRFLETSNGRLTLENLEFVFRRPDTALTDQAFVLFGHNDADFIARDCVFSVAGEHPAGIRFLQMGHTAESDSANGCRCRLTRCYLRGGSLAPFVVDKCPADILLDGCLIVGGNQPFARVAEAMEKAPILRLVRTSVIAGRSFLEIDAGDEGTAFTDCRLWDTVLGCGNGSADSCLVSLVRGIRHKNIKWQPHNCVYAGWRNLLRTQSTTISGIDAAAWREKWIYGDRDRILSSPWPAQHPSEPEFIPANIFDPHGLVVSFANTAGTGAVGCPLDQLPTDRSDRLSRTFKRFIGTPPELPTANPPPIPFANDGLYHGEKIDVDRVGDLGRYLQTRLTSGDLLAPRIVMHVSGTGTHTMSPLVIRGVKEFVLYVTPSADKQPRLTLEPNLTASVNRDALITMHGGSLELIGAHIRFPENKTAAVPKRVVQIHNGRLRLCRCILQGPLAHAPGHYLGLIDMQQSPDETAALEFAFHENVLSSSKRLLELKGGSWRGHIRDSLLISTDDGIVGWPHETPDVQLLFEKNTIAVRDRFLQFGETPDFGPYDTPIHIEAKSNLIVSPFADANRFALIHTGKKTFASGAIEWRGQGNGFDFKRMSSLLTTIDSGSAQSLDEWQTVWGDLGERKPYRVDFTNSKTKIALIPVDQLASAPFPWRRLTLPKSFRVGIDERVPGADLRALSLAVQNKRP